MLYYKIIVLYLYTLLLSSSSHNSKNIYALTFMLWKMEIQTISLTGQRFSRYILFFFSIYCNLLRKELLLFTMYLSFRQICNGDHYFHENYHSFGSSPSIHNNYWATSIHWCLSRILYSCKLTFCPICLLYIMLWVLTVLLNCSTETCSTSQNTLITHPHKQG